VPGNSRRKGDKFVVDLVSAPTQAEELTYIVDQLQRWRKLGYEWHDMAVLCRSKQPVSDALVAAVLW
jgi:superfamily I DNA/RNA helicase